MTYDYKNKLVLVTGASAGLGKHLCRYYCLAGAKIAMVSRNAQTLSALQKELDSQGDSVRCFPADLTDLSGIPSLTDKISASFGRPIDVLVHNAGILGYGEIDQCPSKVVEKVTILNYLAGTSLVQSVLEPMKRQNGGQIIWIGSASSFRGIPRAAAYSASKAAAKCFCEAVRNELIPYGIDVLFVIPGAMDTGFYEAEANYSKDGRMRKMGALRLPSRIAKGIIKAGQKRKKTVILSPFPRIGRHLSYWMPAVLDWLYRRP